MVTQNFLFDGLDAVAEAVCDEAMQAERWIIVDGNYCVVKNALSSGPGNEPHTYDIPGGYVYCVAGEWKLQTPGQFARVVDVVVL